MGRYNTFQKGDNPDKISPPDHHLLSFNYKAIRQTIINFCKNVYTLFYSVWTTLLVSYNYQNKYISPVNIEKIVFF